MTVFVSTSVVVIIAIAAVWIAAINVTTGAVAVEGFEDVRESPVALRDTAAVVIIQIRRSAAATAVVARDLPERQAPDAWFLLGEGFDVARIAQQEGFRVSDGTRGFVFNADMVSVIRFLDIGSRPSNLR